MVRQYLAIAVLAVVGGAWISTLAGCNDDDKKVSVYKDEYRDGYYYDRGYGYVGDKDDWKRGDGYERHYYRDRGGYYYYDRDGRKVYDREYRERRYYRERDDRRDRDDDDDDDDD